MDRVLRMEMETKLSKVWLHIYTQEEYKEDYQMPMLRRNRIPGILMIEGCEEEGMGRYTYDVSGFVSMKTLYEKKRIKKRDIEGVVRDLLRTVESLQQYMLNPDCVLLQPEYIFRKEKKWYFCYLPGYKGALSVSFHELSEYFVKMLDYKDTEGVFLAYEIHKATLQEHYDLSGVMKEYEIHEKVRRRERKELKASEETYGNIFSLTEETEDCEKPEKSKHQVHGQKKYQTCSSTDTIREEGGRYPFWRKAVRHLPGRDWGEWEDLILETDGQEEKSTL